MGVDTDTQNLSGHLGCQGNHHPMQAPLFPEIVRELKGLTREKFCESLVENSEYWGLIERGEQAISLVKLLQVCETYDIPIETVVELDYQTMDDKALRDEVSALLENCKGKQLEMIKKFVEEIVMAL